MSRSAFGVIDIVFSGVAGLLLVALVPMRLLVVPAFAAMFRDFGGELPTTTLLVLSRGFWIGAGALVLALAGTGVTVKLVRGGPTGTWLIAGASLAGLLVIAFTFWAMYAPIFELAGNVRAE